eukprot:m.261097 g.261097  ORF g.261097 m.261097 type:complete len:314 (-) comp41293_c0_seq1:38-979(-)
MEEKAKSKRGGRPSTNALEVRLKRSQQEFFSEEKLTEIFERFGKVTSLRFNPPKAYVTFNEIREAQSAHRYLNNNGQVELGGCKTIATFLSEDEVLHKGFDKTVEELGKPTVVNQLMFDGLALHEEFLSVGEELELLRAFDHDHLWTSQISRRTQHFGYAYDYDIQGSDYSKPIDPFPELLQKLVNKLVTTNILTEVPNQITLQEYTPGQGIPPHIDTVWAFGSEVTSISLLSHCVMRFKPVFVVDVDPATNADVYFPARALMKMTQDARYMWTHMIPARKHDMINNKLKPRARRLSLTFRKVLDVKPPTTNH